MRSEVDLANLLMHISGNENYLHPETARRLLFLFGPAGLWEGSVKEPKALGCESGTYSEHTIYLARLRRRLKPPTQIDLRLDAPPPFYQGNIFGSSMKDRSVTYILKHDFAYIYGIHQGSRHSFSLDVDK
jgi:hypothetical protein